MYQPKLQAPKQNLSITCKGKLFSLHKPIIMGIVNATPDSFFEPSRKTTINEVVKQVQQMVTAGVTIIDIGGQSTRPGATIVGTNDELKRVIPIIEQLNKQFPDLLISIDTFRAEVAKQAVNVGASIVNDVSSGDDDGHMMDTVAKLGVPYIMMHKQGTPANMQQNPTYNNVTVEVLQYFSKKSIQARQAGIIDLILDPGFGFGKTQTHNYELLKNLSAFHITQLPILVGVSRKKMIQNVTQTNAEHALNGTTAVHTIALLNGAHILRVHDVKEAQECINIVSATYGDN